VLITLTLVPNSRLALVVSPLTVFSGLALWFQDLALFFPRHIVAIIPQAWSLGVELMFYLIARFTLRQLSTASLLVVVGLLTSVILWQNGLTQDPWSYRFAPAQASYFGLGACTYHLSKGFRTTNSILLRCVVMLAASGAVLAVIDRGRAVAWGMPLIDYPPLLLHDVWFQLALVVAIPFVFAASNRNRSTGSWAT